MPSFIKDESKWKEAKAAAAKQGKAHDYAYIMGIYNNMGGETKKKVKEKKAPMIANENKMQIAKSELAMRAGELLIKAEGRDYGRGKRKQLVMVNRKGRTFQRLQEVGTSDKVAKAVARAKELGKEYAIKGQKENRPYAAAQIPEIMQMIKDGTDTVKVLTAYNDAYTKQIASSGTGIEDMRAEMKQAGQRIREEVNTRLQQYASAYQGVSAALYSKIKKRGPGEGKKIKLSHDEIKDVLTKTNVGVVSAGRNPKDPQDMAMTDAQIEKRYAKLQKDLVAKGYQFVEGEGKYEGLTEKSFIVLMPDANEKDVIELGKKYNQDSVIYSEKNTNKMIYTVGENAGKFYKGEGFEEKSSDASDFYTQVGLSGGGKMKFLLNFNFDKLEKALASIREFVSTLMKSEKTPRLVTVHGKTRTYQAIRYVGGDPDADKQKKILESNRKKLFSAIEFAKNKVNQSNQSFGYTLKYNGREIYGYLQSMAITQHTKSAVEQRAESGSAMAKVMLDELAQHDGANIRQMSYGSGSNGAHGYAIEYPDRQISITLGRNGYKLSYSLNAGN